MCTSVIRKKKIEMASDGDKLTMTINIRYDANSTIPIRVDPRWNVGRLKQEVSKVKKIPVEEVRIIFQGREIHDAMTIKHCDLGNNSVLHAAHGQSITLDAQMENPELVRRSTSQPESITVIPDHYKSQFFVYCKSRCKEVQAGKIRVRCKKCQYGGFEVDRDPENWDDVLQPNQITGKCLTKTCDGNFVEFFFKCKAHDTGETETSVALNLIKPNPNKVPCVSCFENDKNPIIVWPCDEQHCMCLECFRDYGVANLNDRSFTQHKDVGHTLPCPAEKCNESFIKEPHHFHILGDDQYERYHNFGMEEFVLQSGGVLCPNRDCGAPILPEHCDRKIRCQCGTIFCRNCKEDFHNGECGQVLHPQPAHAEGGRFPIDSSRADQARWDQAAKDKILEISKRCPNCSIPTEKNGGCMHMTCTKCKFHWCWVCVNEWNRECQSDHWFGATPGEVRTTGETPQHCVCS